VCADCSGLFGECDANLFGAAIPITAVVSSLNQFISLFIIIHSPPLGGRLSVAAHLSLTCA